MLATAVHAADLPLGHADFCPSPQRPVGFRGDGTGWFPGATPPTEWADKYGPELGKNVLWKTPMPAWTNSSPIVVGSKVFTLAEPDLLLCADAKTGKVLWQKQVDHLVLWPADEAKKAREAWNQQRALLMEFWTTFEEQQLLNGKPRPGGLHPPVTAPDVAARRERFAKLKAEKGFALGDDNSHLNSGYDLVRNMFLSEDKQMCEAGKANLRIRGELYEKYGFNFEQWRRFVGHTFRTPVSDGQFVYVAMGFGQVACYDLEGNPKWMQWIKPGGKGSKADGEHGHPGQECSMCPSPILMGNRLIVQGGGSVKINLLTAFDKSSGKLLWQTEVGSTKRDVGSPLGMKIGNEELIVLAQGRVVRAADGKVLDPDTIKEGGVRIPCMAANGNRAFFNWCVNHDAKPDEAYVDAVELDAQETAKPLWRATVPGALFVGVTADENYLYVPGVKIGGKMFAIKQADGQVSAVPYPKKKPGFECFGSPPCVAGDKVFWMNGMDGAVLATSSGPALSEIGVGRPVSEAREDEAGLITKGTPTLDEYLKKYGGDQDRFPGKFVMCGGPFFQGNRMYLRTTDYLYCIGPK